MRASADIDAKIY